MVNLFGTNNRLTRSIVAGANPLSSTDKYLICDASNGSLTIELPSIRDHINVLQNVVGSTINIIVFISNETPSSSPNLSTVVASLGETVNGAHSIDLPPSGNYILYATPSEWLLISGSGNNIVINALLNLSDRSIYNVSTKEITIPTALKVASIFTCQADLYSPSEVYDIDDIVRSNGTNGGEDKLSYKSLTNGNVGNNLNDTINWVYADDGSFGSSGSVGNIEVATFGDPNSLPINHISAFRVESGRFGILFISAGSNPSAGQLFLDVNTDVLISNRFSEISFANLFDASVKQPAPMQ